MITHTCGKFWANTVTALCDDSPLGNILTLEALGSWYNFMFCIFLANFVDGSFFMFKFRARFIWCVFTSSNWFCRWLKKLIIWKVKNLLIVDHGSQYFQKILIYVLFTVFKLNLFFLLVSQHILILT